MSGTNQPGSHVLIVGAGSTGLLIAQGLKNANIPFTIFESRPHKTSTRDWSMGLHWGREVLSQFLSQSILDRLSEAEADSSLLSVAETQLRYPGPENEELRKCFSMSDHQETHFPAVNLSTGEEITEIPGKSTRRVCKSRLCGVLGYGVDVQYGRAVSSVETSDSQVTLHFTDGTHTSGDIIVGCDGAKSAIRSSLLPFPRNTLSTFPCLFFNFQARFSAPTAIALKSAYHPIFKACFSATQNMLFLVTTLEVANPADPASWVFQLYFSSLNDGTALAGSRERVRYLKKCAAEGGWAEPFSTAITELDEENVTIEPATIRYMSDLQRFGNRKGRVTLAGDAAHTMCPHRGQGLNNAVLDALEFVKAVKTVASDWPTSAEATRDGDAKSTVNGEGDAAGVSALEKAMTAYDEEVWARGKKEIEISYVQAEMTHKFDVMMQSPLVRRGTYREGGA